MSRISLLQKARENEANLRDQFEARLSAANETHRKNVTSFHERCEAHWTVSINAGAHQISFFLQHQIPYNRYRWEDRNGKAVYRRDFPGDGGSTIDWVEFRKAFEGAPDARWFPRRKAFNEAVLAEEEIVYGAYYLKGGALTEYGRYCLLLKQSFARDAGVMTFLKQDSLQYYTSSVDRIEDFSTVSRDEIAKDVANSSSVTHLACLKKWEEIQESDIDGCMASICSGDEYIEGQCHEKMGFGAVEKIRFMKLTVQERRHLLSFLGSPSLTEVRDVDDEAKKNAYYYLTFRKQFREKGIALEDY